MQMEIHTLQAAMVALQERFGRRGLALVLVPDLLGCIWHCCFSFNDLVVIPRNEHEK